MCYRRPLAHGRPSRAVRSRSSPAAPSQHTPHMSSLRFPRVACERNKCDRSCQQGAPRRAAKAKFGSGLLGGRANRMRPGTPLLQRLSPPLLVCLRQLHAPVERVQHTLELVEGRERLQCVGAWGWGGWGVDVSWPLRRTCRRAVLAAVQDLSACESREGGRVAPCWSPDRARMRAPPASSGARPPRLALASLDVPAPA